MSSPGFSSLKNVDVKDRQMIRDIDGSMRPNARWRMEVSDEEGERLFLLTFTAERMRRTTRS